MVLNQILTYLMENSLIHESHHGSIKERSTSTAVTTLIDTWAYKIENGEELDAITLDQSTVYDLIDHHFLMRKMEILGFQKGNCPIHFQLPQIQITYPKNLSHKKLRKYISFKFARSLASAIFMSKLHYGAELWGPCFY